MVLNILAKLDNLCLLNLLRFNSEVELLSEVKYLTFKLLKLFGFGFKLNLKVLDLGILQGKGLLFLSDFSKQLVLSFYYFSQSSLMGVNA